MNRRFRVDASINILYKVYCSEQFHCVLPESVICCVFIDGDWKQLTHTKRDLKKTLVCPNNRIFLKKICIEIYTWLPDIVSYRICCVATAVSMPSIHTRDSLGAKSHVLRSRNSDVWTTAAFTSVVCLILVQTKFKKNKTQAVFSCFGFFSHHSVYSGLNH